jgi:hypothetical protein
VWGRRGTHTFWWENLQEKVGWEDLGGGGRIRLKLVIKK